jgi:hypothetical protein
MNKYLDIARRARSCAESPESAERVEPTPAPPDLPRISRLSRTFSALESRCPDHVPVSRWQAAVDDGRAFLTRWGNQAEALGWTARDLFGLHTPPAKPHPSYSRLSRYDETGLIWLLCGREVVALTAATAAIQSSTGAITIYRRHNKPALTDLIDYGTPALRAHCNSFL